MGFAQGGLGGSCSSLLRDLPPSIGHDAMNVVECECERGVFYCFCRTLSFVR